MPTQHLFFLHGFLGSPKDWDPVIAELEHDYICHAPKLNAIPSDPDAIIIGYSMGGRIALSLHENFKDLIVISAHPGLTSDLEKKERWQQDLAWIELLQNTSLEDFINLWYQQPLFASNQPLFETLKKRRLENDPLELIALLQRYSLAHQARIIPSKGLFLCGKNDLKYAALYGNLPAHLHISTIKGVGHALHLEAPRTCAEHIRRYLERKR